MPIKGDPRQYHASILVMFLNMGNFSLLVITIFFLRGGEQCMANVD